MEDSVGIRDDFASRQTVRHAARRRSLRETAAAISTKELSAKAFLGLSGLVFVTIWALVWVYVVTCPMAYMDRDYPLAVAKAELAAQCLPDDVAVFGDSRAVVGIMPQVMHIRVTNLAAPGATPIENYFLIKRLLRCSTPPRLVVLAQSAAMYDEPHAFWNIYGHIGILSGAQLAQVKADGRRLHDDILQRMPHPSGVPYALLPLLYQIRFPPLYFGNLLGGYGFARERYNQAVVRNVVANSGQLSFGNAPGNSQPAGEAKMTDWKVGPLMNDYMLRTLAMLRRHHVPVAILTMPVNEATCRQMPSVVQSRLTRYLDHIQKTHPDVVMADPTIGCWPDRDYNDNAHFNEAGALAYSKQFQAKISKLLRSEDVSTAADD